MPTYLHQLPVNMTTNITDIMGLINYVQTQVPIGEMTMIMIFFVSFIAMKKYTSERALVGSVIITWLTSILLFFAGMVNNFVPLAMTMALIVVWFVARAYQSSDEA